MQLTERAAEELQRLLRDNLAGPRQGVRLRLEGAGHLAMTIDAPHLGDTVMRRDTTPLLIIDARLADRLAPRVLDFASRGDGWRQAGFVLLWRTPEEAAPIS